jgi:predicted component of type VI protein secretion system
MQFRLRYGAHDIELIPGEFTIGRSEECQLSLDDAMVSRRHLSLRISSSSVVAVDLGSRNGVSINGTRLKAERLLVDGDRIKIGQHEMVLQVMRRQPHERRLSTRTLQAVDIRDLESTAVRDDRPPATPVPSVDAGAKFAVLAQLANKAFALGHVEEAERILARPLGDILEGLKAGQETTPALVDKAASYAIRLAIEANKASWIDWVIEAYHEAERLLPSQMVEDIHGAVRKVRGANRDVFERYVETMTHAELSATERFILQRIQGLRPLLI